MHQAWILLSTTLWVTALGQAQETPNLRIHIDAYENAVRANTQRIIEASSDEERNRYRASIPSAEPYAERVLAALQAEPERSDAIEGLNWLLTQCLHLPQGRAALDLLAIRYLNHPGIAPAVRLLESAEPEKTAPLLDKIRTQNPNPEARAAATFSLAQQLFRQSESDPDSSARSQSKTRASELFQTIVTDYPSVSIGGFRLADQAAAMLFEIQNLTPGATAPEIVGTDQTGQTFRLSDYRGRPVVLVFWGDWCHACHSLPALLQQLHKRFGPDRLHILGVNTDAPDVARTALAKLTLSWRCWLDGTTSGPITSTWNLRHFPTLYLIGPNGVIIAKDPAPEQLSQSLQKLLDPL